MDRPEPPPQEGDEPNRLPDIAARQSEIVRITAEIAEVKRLIEEERQHSSLPDDRDVEIRSDIAEWQALSREEQMEWIANMRQFVIDHPDELMDVSEVEGMLDRLERISHHHASLVRLEDEAEDLILQTQADEAEAATRLIVAMAEIMATMERFTDEDWENIPQENRAGLVDLLNSWHNGQREECLSQLPIELRRRYE